MKTSALFIFMVSVFSVLAANASTGLTRACLMAQEERMDSIKALGLGTAERRQLLKQCIQSKKEYWFTTELYLVARSFGDSHVQALAEFSNFLGIDYSIADYKKMRTLSVNSGRATVQMNREKLKLLSKLARK